MLTERIIRDATPTPGKTYIIWDNKIKGLGLRVSPGGTKAFILKYRSGGRIRKPTLAKAGEVSLKAVRERAGLELVKVRAGDPGPAERRHELQHAPVVNDGLDRYFNEYARGRIRKGTLAQSTVKKYRAQADKFIRPTLGKLRIDDVKRMDVEAMTQRLQTTPYQHNRVLALASLLFNLFEQWEWRRQNSNPAKGVERAREHDRDRTFTQDEIAALASVLREDETARPATVAVIRFCMVTGLRIGEVLTMRWKHIDFDTGRLLIPESKTGRRWHDLPTAALDILARLPDPEHDNMPVFVSKGRKVAVVYKTVHQHFSEIKRRASIPDVRPHDMRRTVMTQAAASGIGTHVLRDLLGHKTSAMADRYIRSVGNPVRDAREEIGAKMAAMMDEAQETAEVLPFKKNDNK